MRKHDDVETHLSPLATMAAVTGPSARRMAVSRGQRVLGMAIREGIGFDDGVTRVIEASCNLQGDGEAAQPSEAAACGREKLAASAGFVRVCGGSLPRSGSGHHGGERRALLAEFANETRGFGAQAGRGSLLGIPRAEPVRRSERRRSAGDA